MSVYKRANSPYFWAKFTLLDKKYQFSTRCRRKTDARKVEEIRKRGIIDGTYYKRTEAVSLEALMDTYNESHMKSRPAYETYCRCARNVVSRNSPLAGLNAHEVEQHHIEAYRNWRLRTVKPASINREMSVLRAAYNYQKKKFPVNPVSLVKFFSEEEFQRRRYLFPDEKHALLEHSQYPLSGMIYLDLKTGLRLSELLRLQWNHVDLQSNRLWVMKSKSGRQRAVPLLPGVREMLKRLPKRGGFVFCHEDGRPFLKTEIRKGWERVRKKVRALYPDRDNFVFHDIRRTFGSELAQRGVSEKAIATLLGHSSIYVTQRYAHLSPSSLDTAMSHLEEKLDNDSYSSGYIRATLSGPQPAEELLGKSENQAGSTKNVESGLVSGEEVCRRGDLNPHAA